MKLVWQMFQSVVVNTAAAVEKQLEELARAFPKRRVVLVTFNKYAYVICSLSPLLP
mgnify:CR=1 FL=1